MRYAILLCAISGACSSGGSGGSTVSAPVEPQNLTISAKFVNPHQDGSIAEDFDPDGQTITGSRQNTDQDGYAYQLGETLDGSYRSMAGLLPSTTITAPPTTGTIAYAADYNVVSLENIREVDGELHAFGGVAVNGDIMLTANFDTGTLLGEADTNTNSGLIVSGSLDGPSVSGEVLFRGVTGDLTGLAGQDDVVITFVGQSDNMIYAGGAIGSATP